MSCWCSKLSPVTLILTFISVWYISTQRAGKICREREVGCEWAERWTVVRLQMSPSSLIFRRFSGWWGHAGPWKDAADACVTQPAVKHSAATRLSSGNMRAFSNTYTPRAQSPWAAGGPCYGRGWRWPRLRCGGRWWGSTGWWTTATAWPRPGRWRSPGTVGHHLDRRGAGVNSEHLDTEIHSSNSTHR